MNFQRGRVREEPEINLIPFIDVLVVTGVIVALMIYVVMPHYTRLVHRWLFR